MNKQEKLNIFAIELDFLTTDVAKMLAGFLLDYLPDYFWTIPASSSGKYHPSFALGDGGLVRHTKAAMHIAQDLMQLEQFSGITKYHDEILIALMVHDGFKQGMDATSHTLFDHPLFCANKLKEWLKSMEALFPSQGAYSHLEIIINRIIDMVESHMGQWNTSKYSDVELPKPTTSLQQFVHLCDYLASRKWVTIEGFSE